MKYLSLVFDISWVALFCFATLGSVYWEGFNSVNDRSKSNFMKFSNKTTSVWSTCRL